MKRNSKLLLVLSIVFFTVASTFGQASLSVQGILKKSNGVAVDDGLYNITFKLYTQEAGGAPIWTEPQSNVEVSSGIYSAVLGQNPTYPLNVPFDVPYYLGVSIGGGELSPRIVLTSAPYALSLIGNSNQFPSSGKVTADSMVINGGLVVRGGTPGLNGANGNGYAFSGNNGDNDSGMFSTGDGKVSLYSNNSEILRVDGNGVNVTGNLSNTGTFSVGNVNLNSGGNIQYNGILTPQYQVT